MKKLIFSILAVTLFATSQAQIKFGVKAGLNLANLTGDATDSKIKTDFHGGGLVEIPVGKIFAVQPEILYSGQGAKSSEDGTDFKLNLGYLNIPVLFKYNNPSGFFAVTGPQIGFLLNAQAKAGSDHQDVKSAFNSTDFSWAFGVGYLIKSVNAGIEARFNQGLSNIAKNEQGSSVSIKNQVIQIGLVYVFGGGEK
jgi:hypothetical protein